MPRSIARSALALAVSIAAASAAHAQNADKLGNVSLPELVQ